MNLNAAILVDRTCKHGLQVAQPGRTIEVCPAVTLDLNASSAVEHHFPEVAIKLEKLASSKKEASK